MNWTLLLPLVVIAGTLLNGLRLRARVRALTVLAASGDPVPGSAGFVLGEGVRLDEATAKAAAAHARRTGLAVIDLIPEDLHTIAALDLLREVDPAAYEGDRLAAGRGAGQAVYADAGVLGRAGDPGRPLDRGEFISFLARLKPYAPDTTGLAVAPSLRAAKYDPARRRSAFRVMGVPVHLALPVSVLPYALLAASVALSPVAGAVAAVVYSLQPYLIFAGGPLRPRGLHVAALLRVIREPYVMVRTVIGPWRSAAEIDEDRCRTAARAGYERDLSGGTERFLEPRRNQCSWCGSETLGRIVRSQDLVQRKPGRFALEKCGSCGHVFQNPRLSLEGLDFYYRDFYDGLGEKLAEAIFGTGPDSYEGRATMVAPFGTPKAWLDVGAGHGHFCVYAREIWPDTAFDGLDMGDAIDEAARRGWISRAYKGMFPELVDEVAGCYDVISMHHYLEHTRDPLAELDTAAKALLPGGHLLIELPDPEWPMRRLFGRFWMPWFPPQHQHLMPLGNLKRALAERGLTPVAEERAAAHMENDFVLAAYLAFSQLTPNLDVPWSRSPATWWRHGWRAAVWMVGVPVLIACVGLDKLTGRYACRKDLGNAYRVLARRDDSG